MGSSGLSFGPTIFTLYTTYKFNVTHHLYADDTQNYLELDSRNFDSSIIELENCLEAIQASMGKNKLKFNPNKTELILNGNEVIIPSKSSS